MSGPDDLLPGEHPDVAPLLRAQERRAELAAGWLDLIRRIAEERPGIFVICDPSDAHARALLGARGIVTVNTVIMLAAEGELRTILLGCAPDVWPIQGIPVAVVSDRGASLFGLEGGRLQPWSTIGAPGLGAPRLRVLRGGKA
jgi:hypothetical protein